MAVITIGTETEVTGRWIYEVHVDQDGSVYDFTVTLGWSDYDLWCRGRLAPQRVVRGMFEFLLARGPASGIPPRFDCAVVRRHHPDVDRELPKAL